MIFVLEFKFLPKIKFKYKELQLINGSFQSTNNFEFFVVRGRFHCQRKHKQQECKNKDELLH